VRQVVVSSVVDDAGLEALRRPQDHFVRERAAGPDRFGLDTGPFTHWDRRVAVDPEPAAGGRHRVTTTADFIVAGPGAQTFVAPLVAWNLRHTGGAGKRTWWMPPLMDARASSVLAVLSVFSLYTGYLGVLLSQTNAYFGREFGADASQLADAQIAVRIGAFAALAVAALADRRGRRRVLLISTVLAIAFTATGAFAPNLLAITVSQGLARAFSAAVGIVVAVMATEEVPADARAGSLSVLALAAGLGGGGVVTMLWINALSPSAWRFLYLLPLPFLATVPWLARRLPETRRFEVHELGVEATGGDPPAPGGSATTVPSAVPLKPVQPVTDATPAMPVTAAEPAPPAMPTDPGDPDDSPSIDAGSYRRRLLLVGVMLLSFNFFLTPQAGFTNDYLLRERQFSDLQITLFQVLTNLPAGLSIVVGGRLADTYGRRRIGLIGIVGSGVACTIMFWTAGWTLWISSTAFTVLLGLMVPTVLVYPTEMFPTGRRSGAQGWTNLAAVAGAVIGLKLCGSLAVTFGSFGPAITVLALGLVVTALVVVFGFPETSGVELETINPGDAPPPVGDELAALDRTWEAAREGGVQLAVHEHDEESGTPPG
jgi:MFS family permease